MWIDINAYIDDWPYKKLKFSSCPELIDQMDKFGIDISVIQSLNGIFYKNTQKSNQDLYKAWNSSKKDLKSRLIPFATINPTYAGWEYDFEQSIGEWTMKGVCVYPKYHDYSIDHPNLIKLVRMAREQDIIVALSLRMVDSRQRSWLDIDQEWALKDVMPLISMVPDAKYFIGNVANSTMLDKNDLELLTNSTVLLDTSGRATNNLNALLEEFGSDKFAFGSHSPILDYCTGRLRVEYLEVDERTKDMIRYQNAADILNIS